MTIQEAQAKVDAWINQYGVRYFNELTNMAILTEEVGEVARIIARTYGEQSPGSTPVGKEALADELADVLFVIICLANQTGINLEDAFSKNLEKKTSRDFDRHQQNDKLNYPSSGP
jgi:NTP pyrophosphatase (non-canonical NTP hydrolase)